MPQFQDIDVVVNLFQRSRIIVIEIAFISTFDTAGKFVSRVVTEKLLQNSGGTFLVGKFRQLLKFPVGKFGKLRRHKKTAVFGNTFGNRR